MTTCFLAPDPIQGTFFIPGGNTPGAGAQVFFYVSGTANKQTVYKDNAAATPWTNPIVLDSGGNLPAGAEVWFPQGQLFTVKWAPFNDSDPPVSPYRTMDNLSGMNDVSAVTGAEWITGPTPTFVSATQFTLAADQRATFQVGRRVQASVTAGTSYGSITASAFGGGLTTVTVDTTGSIPLDAGLSAVNYGLLSATNPSVPPFLGGEIAVIDTTDRSKVVKFSASSLANSSVTNLNVQSQGSGSIALLAQISSQWLTGYSIANNVSSNAMDINGGFASDSNSTVVLAGPFIGNKTQASFAAGASSGAKLTAAGMSSNAWYAWYALGSSSSAMGAVDYGFDTIFPPASPTTTAAFPFFRYIGARRTNVSTTAWIPMVQHADAVYYQTPPPLDVNGTTASLLTRTLTTVASPPKVVEWVGHLQINAGGTGVQGFNLTDPAAADVAPSSQAFPLATMVFDGAASQRPGSQVRCWTNTSSQIGVRAINSSSVYWLQTLGWIDPRGRPS